MPDAEREGPSLEPPTLFGRKKSAPPTPSAPAEKRPLVLPKAEERSALRIPRPIRRPRPVVPEGSLTPATPAVQVEPDLPPEARTDPEPDAEPGPLPDAHTDTQVNAQVNAQPDSVGADGVGADEPAAAETPRPRAPGRYAALATGLLVGLFGYGLGWATIGTCRGIAGDCETVPSVLIFVAIGLVAVAAGAALLRVFAIPDPASTSLFAVGFVSLVTFLFLTDQLDTWPMALIVPSASAISFFLSWWLTTSWTETDHI